MTGQTISHYRVLEKLGEGGMGVVYKAEDTKLRRAVALKFLPSHATENRERFLREAQAAASLNHPNICTVFEVDEEHALIAMELVEGNSVKDKIAERPLKLDEALDIAIQTCQGLQAAHDKGVVHRDIKPANLMVAGQGQVKIMDFGLAQIGDRTRLTKTGASLGTPAYMSPQQARGEPADRRTDLWSLGVTLYEMLAGKPAFSGDREAAVARAIIFDTPEPLTACRAGLPLELDRIIAKALRKQAEERYQNAADMLVDLRSLMQPAASTANSMRSNRLRNAAIVAALLALFPLGFFAGRRNRKTDTPIPISFLLHPDEGGSQPHQRFALSPDGSTLAYAAANEKGVRMIWLRQLQSPAAVPLAGTEDGLGPFWSPDGAWIGFSANGKLKKILKAGGSPFELADSTSSITPAWSPGGDLAFNVTNRSALSRLSTGSGPAVPWTSLNPSRQENSHRFPFFLPDGRLMFTARATKDNTGIFVELANGEKRLILGGQHNAAYAPDGDDSGFLLFVRDGTLFARRFQPKSLSFSGDPHPVASGLLQTGDFGAFAISANGKTLAYAEGEPPKQQLTWFAPDGRKVGTLGPPAAIIGPRIAPDGKNIVYSQPDPRTGNRDLWIQGIESQVVDRITLDPNNDWQPAWSWDGRRILFASDREGGVLKPFAKGGATSAAAESRLGDFRADPMDWSPDGRFLIYSNSGLGELLVYPLDGTGKPAPLFKTGAHETDAKFAPDGRAVAYTSDKSGQPEVYLRAFDTQAGVAGSAEHRVSSASGATPRWRRDGKELYFLDRDHNVMAVSVAEGRPSPPKRLFQSCAKSFWVSNWESNYDVSADGSKFLFACPAQEEPMKIHVVVNWRELLPKR